MPFSLHIDTTLFTAKQFLDDFHSRIFFENPENPERKGGALLHLPFTCTMFLLYLWMKCSRHKTMFLHCKPYEIMMIISVPAAIIRNVPERPQHTMAYILAEIFSMLICFIINPAYQFSYTFTNVLILYMIRTCNYVVAAGYRVPLWVVHILSFGITLCIGVLLSRQKSFPFRDLIVSLFFLVPQTVLVVLNLLIWFIWWLKVNNQQPLSPVKIAFVISAVIYVAVNTLYGVFWIILSFCIPEIEILPFDFHYIYYIPHYWILVAVISSHPEVQRLFQKKKDQNAEVFQLAYIPV